MAPLEHGATTGEEHTRNTRGSQATVGGEVVIVVDTGGVFIFVSEVPVSSTQFLLRVGRAT